MPRRNYFNFNILSPNKKKINNKKDNGHLTRKEKDKQIVDEASELIHANKLQFINKLNANLDLLS